MSHTLRTGLRLRQTDLRARCRAKCVLTMRPALGIVSLSLLLCLCSWPAVAADRDLNPAAQARPVPVPVRGAAPRGTVPLELTTTAAIEADEIHDAILLLENGPIHLRFHFSLGGVSLPKSRDDFVNRLMKLLDTDRNGKLMVSEARRSPLLRENRKRQENPFLASLEKDRMVTRSDVVRTVEKLGSLVKYRQDESGADNDLEIFKVLDADGSGTIDRTEMRSAPLRVRARDEDRDGCVTFTEFLPPPSVDNRLLLTGMPDSGQPAPEIANIVFDTRDRRLGQHMLRMFDRNGDSKLTAAELQWDAARLATIDADKSGTLDRVELTQIALSPVDVELSIDLGVGDKDRSPLRVLAAGGHRIDQQRGDEARITLGLNQITLSYRQVDSVKEAVDSALKIFNELDVDQNGYLERTETESRFLFERFLFDAMDADGNGKIFVDELREYATLRGEPDSFSCQVNLYNVGRGFFQLLDASGDGRISLRELRNMEKSLAQSARENQPLTPNSAGRHYRVEFVRGSYRLYGRNETMTAQSQAFIQRPPVGPVWFQRMDRNSDGDLTWQEFLGPRRDFDRLDADHDGLIDFKEAEAADSL